MSWPHQAQHPGLGCQASPMPASAQHMRMACSSFPVFPQQQEGHRQESASKVSLAFIDSTVDATFHKWCWCETYHLSAFCLAMEVKSMDTGHQRLVANVAELGFHLCLISQSQ
eukprot:6077575-Amphidinium_carterae.1